MIRYDANDIFSKYSTAIDELKNSSSNLENNDYENIQEFLKDIFKNDEMNLEYASILNNCLKCNSVSNITKTIIKNIFSALNKNKDDIELCIVIARVGILSIKKELDEFKSDLHQDELQFNAKNKVVSDNNKK